jgi:hypothetical protein
MTQAVNGGPPIANLKSQIRARYGMIRAGTYNPMGAALNSKHTWRFSRIGGFDQVELASGADLAALDQLDQKLWVALACPTTNLEFDSKTLALIDADKDGRIRAPDIIAATKWVCSMLKNPDDLRMGAAEISLSAINDSSLEGGQLLSSVRQILAGLNKSQAQTITLEDTANTAAALAQTLYNGDGIIPSDSAQEPEAKALVEDIIACLGAETDHSGKPGVSQAKVDLFFTEAQAYMDWRQEAVVHPQTLPLGEATAEAYAACQAVKPKLEDYFARCRLAAFDPRSEDALNRDENDYLSFTAKELTLSSAEIAALPLSRIRAGRPLPLREGVNPAWADAMARFEAQVVKPLLGAGEAISEDNWAALKGCFAPYEAWIAAKTGGSVEKLGIERLRAILAGPGREALSTLIAADLTFEAQVNDIAAVEKLLRLHRDLFHLLNNFVSFRDFYSGNTKAIFQAGTLFLDQRSCDLCLRVDDPAKHAAMAGPAGAYLTYCDCVRKATGEKMQIVAAFTNGDSDNLLVGRNGLFYDRQGRDWDATITRIQDNPISIRQAFWAPYKKAARAIQEQFAKRATSADELAVSSLARMATVPQEPGATPARQISSRIDPGMIAALSVGVAGLGGMIGGIATGFLALRWMMPLGLLAIIGVISGPSMVLAWLKLRRRNLGPILDASGWAVNARARINVPFGASLTRVAVLPPGAQRDLADPFPERRPRWWLYLLILLLLLAVGLAWWEGAFDEFLSGPARSTSVLGTNAPASQRQKAK